MSERRRVATQGRGEPSVWRDESGKFSIRGIFALALMVGMVYFGMKVIPARASAYQFDDAIRDEVVFAGGRRSSDEAITRSLVDRAAMLGLPIKAEVSRGGRSRFTDSRCHGKSVSRGPSGCHGAWSLSSGVAEGASLAVLTRRWRRPQALER